MAAEFSLAVVAPDREVVSASAVSIVAPGVDGYFGVWAGHVPVVSALKPGILEYIDGSNIRHHVYVGVASFKLGRIQLPYSQTRREMQVISTSAKPKRH